MTRLIARLILAMLTLPLSGAVFLVALLPLTRMPGPPSAAGVAVVWGITSGFVFTYWIAIWRGSVRWTRERVIQTALAIAMSIAVGICAGVVIKNVIAKIPSGPAAMIAGGLTPIVFVFATVFIWRETAEERQARLAARGVETVACLTCGYNLTGLREARCPECGATFTLETLLAGQFDEREKELVDAD